MPHSKYYTGPQPLCLGITIGSIGDLQPDELEEEMVEWVRFSSIKVPVVNKEATNTPTWTLPPIPPMDPYHSSAFFAEYNFEIEDGAWRSEIVQWNKRDTVVIGTNAGGEELWSTLVYRYKEGALEVLCWMLYGAHDGSENGQYVPMLMTANARPMHADPTINRADRSTGAGDIAEWAPAFKVGSTRQNVISVVDFLLTKFRAVHPHAPEDEDTAIVID